MYKLLLLDVDGTLLRAKGDRVSAAVIDAVAKIKDTVHVSLCTGRTHLDTTELIQDLGIGNNYHIIESGAKVLNPLGEEENVKHITKDEINWIVDEAGDTPAGYGYCADGIWLNEMDKIGKSKVTTVALHSHSENQTKKIMDRMGNVKEKFHIGVGSHWQIKDGSFILITNKDASKKSAIEYVQNKLSISKSEAIGIGDMLNDLPLFEASGFKIAMGNGVDELKAKADFVAPSIDDDGVAVAVYKYFTF